jgi:hypothetical protein
MGGPDRSQTRSSRLLPSASHMRDFARLSSGLRSLSAFLFRKTNICITDRLYKTFILTLVSCQSMPPSSIAGMCWIENSNTHHANTRLNKIQNFKKAQKRTKFVFGVSRFARRPHPGSRQKSKTSKSLKIVQSLILGFLGSLDGRPRIKTKCKTSKSLKIIQSLILGFLGSLDGQTPDEDKNAKRQKASKSYKV